MKIIFINHTIEYCRPDAPRRSLREGLSLDHIGGELRSVYGDVESEPLPDSLSALAALLDQCGDRGDAA